MRVWLAAAVVASLALAGAVQAQAQTGAWKVGSGTPVTLKGSNPATGEPNSSSLAVGCNLRTGRIYGSVSVIPFSFPNGKAVLTWDEREDVLRTFEGLEGFDYPTILLLTEDLSFLDNIIGHNRLTVSAEVEIEGRRARMESRFDLSGSQAAFRTISCWPPPAQAQAQTGAWKVGSGTPVTLKGSNPATGEPNSSSLAVGCNLRTGRIYGSVSVIPFSFPNGKAVLTWDEREDVLRTFEGLEGFDYPTILLLTEDLSFLDNIIGHNRLTVSAEVEIEGRRARMESRFDLSGSQAAFRTISCWPPPARPAPSNPPSEALEPSGSPASGNLTAAQRNAVRSANSYLQLSGFSRQGLIDQLSSEVGDSYSVGDATVAVNSLSTDWNAQAARSAVSYLELSGFSCRGLIDQLSSEAGDKYTVEQATYGATQAGICGALMPDSTPEQTEQSAAPGSHLAASGNLTAAQRNAVRSANSYLQLSGFSRQGLIDQLSSEVGDSYSVGDATVAVNSLSTDWNAQAARSAVSYLELSGFSCRGLIDQLSSEAGDKYTVEQATYGATQAGIC